MRRTRCGVPAIAGRSRVPRGGCAFPGAGGAMKIAGFANHRRGNTIPGPVGAANRAASSKQARCFRRWRRFACFPHFLWVLPKDYARRRASEANRPSGRLLGRRETGRARSKRKVLFSPLYTKADGSFLKRFRPGPEASCRLRLTLVIPESFPPQRSALGVCRGGELKGLFLYSRALRAYPGSRGEQQHMARPSATPSILINHPGSA